MRRAQGAWEPASPEFSERAGRASVPACALSHSCLGEEISGLGPTWQRAAACASAANGSEHRCRTRVPSLCPGPLTPSPLTKCP